MRWTFIEAGEGTPAKAPRACSAPAAKRREIDEEASAAEELRSIDGERYVAGLSESLGRLWSAADASGRPGDVSAGFFAAASAAARDRAAACDRQAEHSDAQQPEAFENFADSSADISSDAVAMNSPRSESATVATAEVEMVNEGSVGHPFLCSRPCLYFVSGTCANGGSCAFCHMRHPKRAAHLDKKHRDILRALPVARAKALMLPVIWQKVSEVDASSPSQRAFAEFAHAHDVDDFALPHRMSRPERALVGTLNSLGLKTTLTMFQRTAEGAGEDRCTAAVEALVRELRGIQPASGHDGRRRARTCA